MRATEVKFCLHTQGAYYHHDLGHLAEVVSVRFSTVKHGTFLWSFAFSLGEYKADWTDAFVFFPTMSARCFLNINDPIILLETELTFSFL